MPRKTRRRIIRGKRVRGTKRVRIYYRGGNRRYNGEGGFDLREFLGLKSSTENNPLSNVATSVGNAAASVGNAATSAATSASNKVRTFLNPKTSETSLFGLPSSPPL